MPDPNGSGGVRSEVREVPQPPSAHYLPQHDMKLPDAFVTRYNGTWLRAISKRRREFATHRRPYSPRPELRRNCPVRCSESRCAPVQEDQTRGRIRRAMPNPALAGRQQPGRSDFGKIEASVEYLKPAYAQAPAS